MTKPSIAACILATAGWPSTAALACPACKAMIAERTSQLGALLATGLYWSILVLLLVPFGLVGFVAWLIVRATRRHQALLALRAAALGSTPHTQG